MKPDFFYNFLHANSKVTDLSVSPIFKNWKIDSALKNREGWYNNNGPSDLNPEKEKNDIRSFLFIYEYNIGNICHIEIVIKCYIYIYIYIYIERERERERD